MNYIPKFVKGKNDVINLDETLYYKECLEFAKKHCYNVLYTDTTCTSSISVIVAFEKLGYRHEFIEEPVWAGNLQLTPRINCFLTL